MGSLHNWHTNKQVSISLLFFLSAFIFIHVTFMAEGRGIEKPLMEGQSRWVELDEKMWMVSQLGSRPPSCQRRCKECNGQCEAVQVPVQNNQRKRRSNHFSASKHDIAQSNQDDTSNYKLMSWKCKCANFIFNP